jgi:hypothetical protein
MALDIDSNTYFYFKSKCFDFSKYIDFVYAIRYTLC